MPPAFVFLAIPGSLANNSVDGLDNARKQADSITVREKQAVLYPLPAMDES